jgi:lysophospholipase L1-like esterase
MVIGPPDYAAKPIGGGPSALERLERDVISLPNVSTVVWLEGINDFGSAGAETKAVSEGVRDAVKRLRAGIPGVKVVMATLTSSLHSTPTHGTPAVEEKRRAYNDFIKTSGNFDGVVDFDAATIDPATGELKAEFQPNSTTGGPGDKLHPNRAGYAAMGQAIDLGAVFGNTATKR